MRNEFKTDTESWDNVMVDNFLVNNYHAIDIVLKNILKLSNDSLLYYYTNLTHKIGTHKCFLYYKSLVFSAININMKLIVLKDSS